MVEKWETVESVQGQLQAEILRGLLEAQGVRVFLNQEGAGVAYGINVGPLGTVEIMVPTSEMDQARQILTAYYSGEYEETVLDNTESEEDDASGGEEED